VELVDTPDLKSCDHLVVRVQVPPRVHRETPVFSGVSFLKRLFQNMEKEPKSENPTISSPINFEICMAEKWFSTYIQNRSMAIILAAV
tara:strand:- start:12 stop:275 length:264 start_codon:yes stop_codon:yes gene_type:complete